MPFYTDSGEAIIPKPKPEPTTTTKSTAVIVKPPTPRPSSGSLSRPKPKPVVETVLSDPSPQQTVKQLEQIVSPPVPSQQTPSQSTPSSQEPFVETLISESQRFSSPSRDSRQYQASPSQVVTQIVQDAQKGITPVERQLIDQAPSPTITPRQLPSQYDFITTFGEEKEVEKLQKLETLPPIGPSLKYDINPFHKLQQEVTQKQYVETYESMPSSAKIGFTKEFARFGEEGDKTWAEVKKEEPALYLKYKSGKVVAELDTRRWRTELYEGKDPLHANISKFSSGVMVALDPGSWMSLITKGEEGISQYMGDWQYGMYKDYGVGTKDVDVVKYVTGRGVLQSPGYMNVVYPFAGGAAVGAVFKGVSLAARGATGLAGKALTHVASKGPLVVGGVASGVAGADIGYSFATDPEHEGKGMAKVLQYGMQFGFAMAGAKVGAKAVETFRPKWHQVQKTLPSGEKVDLFKKYLFEYKGKPRLHYGKTGIRTGFEPDFTNYQGQQLLGKSGTPPSKIKVPDSFIKNIVGSKPIPSKGALVPYKSLLPSTQVGLKPIHSLFLSTSPKNVSFGVADISAPQIKTGTPQIPYFKEVARYLNTKKALPDFTTHKGHPFEPSYTTDAMKYLSTQVKKGYTHVFEYPTEIKGYGKIDAIGITTYSHLRFGDNKFPTIMGEKRAISDIGIRDDIYTMPDKYLKGILKHEAIHLTDPTLTEEQVRSFADPDAKIDKPYYFPKGPDPFLKGLHDFARSKTQLSTVVHPKPVPYQAYKSVGFGKVSITPYWTGVGKSFMVKTSFMKLPTTAILKSIAGPPKPQITRTWDKDTPLSKIKAADSFYKETVGTQPIPKKMSLVPKKDTSVMIPKNHWWHTGEHINFNKFLLESKPVKTSVPYSKSVARFLGTKKALPDFTTHKGYPLGETRPPTKKLVLRNPFGTALTKRMVLPLGYSIYWGPKPVAVKPFYKLLGKPIKKHITLKDLASKWEMEKSDFDSKPIELGSGRTKLLLKPPKIITDLELKTTTQLKKSQTKLIEVKKGSLDKILKGDIGKLKTVQVLKTKPVALIDTRKDILSLFPSMDTKKKSLSIFSPMYSTKQDISLDIGFDTKKASITGQKTDTIFKQGQKFDMVYDTIPDLTSDITYDTIPDLASKKIIDSAFISKLDKPQVSITEQVPQLLPMPKMGEVGIGTSDKAYNVRVKTRMFVKGKKVRPGKFRKINRKPLSYADALALGGNKLDKTGRATMRIEETEGKPHKLKKDVKPWSNIMHQFDFKPDGRIVERTAHRISTPGEIRDISKLGWEASKSKPKKKIISKNPPKNFLKTTKPDKKISKLMKKMGLV